MGWRGVKVRVDSFLCCGRGGKKKGWGGLWDMVTGGLWGGARRRRKCLGWRRKMGGGGISGGFERGIHVQEREKD